MSSDKPITKENLDEYLKSLGKEFRKMNGTKTPAEVVLIGGAAILAGYGFRDMTYDIDALIHASSTMKDAISHVSDKYGLPNDWLNTDFRQTKSYSDKLFEVSVYYKTFSNILTVRIVTAEHLIAMKLISGRQYKNDLSDIIGILLEHQKRNMPISKDAIDSAITTLYGESIEIPEATKKLLDEIFIKDDYETLYRQSREGEKDAKAILLDFDEKYPGELQGENINAIIEAARRKRQTTPNK